MAKVDLEDLIARVLKRVRWLDEKCEIYEHEITVQLKIIDQFNKTLASLLKLLLVERELGPDPMDEFTRILEEVQDVQEQA